MPGPAAPGVMILDAQAPQAIAQAAQALRDGELIGLPTETVYGLGADASNDTAVARIFAAKGRPADHPLIVHLAQPPDACDFAAAIPAFAQALMQAFWPGPLTLILPRRAGVAAAAAGGQDSIGLRCPAHPVAQAVLRAARALGVPGVAAPSANRFGRVSPTTAQHVQDELGPGLLVLDGGPCAVGIESTIVDCTRGVPVLLRPGVITPQQLQDACGQPVRRAQDLSTAAPRASGTLESHYAPSAQVRLMDAATLKAALDLLPASASTTTDTRPERHAGLGRIGVYARTLSPSAAPQVLWRPMPDDAAATAQQLFAVLREFDAQGATLIWVETPPAMPQWEGVRDRLTRAAA